MASFVSSQNSFLLSSDLIIPVFQITFNQTINIGINFVITFVAVIVVQIYKHMFDFKIKSNKFLFFHFIYNHSK